MGPEGSPGQTENSELLLRHFDTIVKILKSKVHETLIKQYMAHADVYGMQKTDGSNEFKLQGKTFGELEEEINGLVIIRPNEVKTTPEKLYIMDFITKYGLPVDTIDEILSKFFR